SAAAKDGAVEVHAHDEVPIGLSDLGQLLPPRNTGVRDEDVETSHGRNGLDHQPLVLLGPRYIGAHEHRAPSVGLDLGEPTRGFLGVRDVVDDDVEATLGECPDDAGADSAVTGGPGDESNRHAQLGISARGSGWNLLTPKVI